MRVRPAVPAQRRRRVRSVSAHVRRSVLPVQHRPGPQPAVRLDPRSRPQRLSCARRRRCGCSGGDVAAVLDAVKPLVALLAQAVDPHAAVAQALEHAATGVSDLLVADVAAAVTDRTLARTTLTFAGVLDPD